MAAKRILSDEEIREIVRMSYGHSAPLIAHRVNLPVSRVRKIIREARGKQYPWGEREKDRGGRNPTLPGHGGIKGYIDAVRIGYLHPRGDTSASQRIKIYETPSGTVIAEDGERYHDLDDLKAHSEPHLLFTRQGRSMKRKNAGLFSKRKTKKVRGQGGSDAWAGHVKAKSKATKARRAAKRNPTRWGTSYFVSRAAAIRYYRDYGYDDVKGAVARKIREGEIHIGKPPLKAGQRLATTDGGKRYEIIEPNPNVYDASGKLVGKFKRKAAKIAARVVGGTVGRPTAKNPARMLFNTPAAALNYANAHGLRVKALEKVRKA